MIIGLIGGMSSGKTCTLAKFLYEDHLAKREIYANFSLNFPSKLITQKEIFEYASQKKELIDVSIGFDEFYIYVDSRMSGAKRNLLYSYFILQTSKRNIRLYYTAQNFHTIDKRIRENTHVLIELRPVLVRGNTFKEFHSSERILKPDRLKEFHIMATYHYLFANRKGKMQLIKPDRYFSLYDTSEVIAFDNDMFTKNKKESR